MLRLMRHYFKRLMTVWITKLIKDAEYEQFQGVQKTFGHCGYNVQINGVCLVFFPERFEVGDHVYLGPNFQAHARGGIVIGSHSIVGPDVLLLSSTHNFKQPRLIPYDEIELLKPIKIGEAVWLGARVTVLPGVELGMGCVVGAGSVVTKSFQAGSIVAGNPAKVIRMRNTTELMAMLRDGRTYLKIKLESGLQKRELRDESSTG